MEVYENKKVDQADSDERAGPSFYRLIHSRLYLFLSIKIVSNHVNLINRTYVIRHYSLQVFSAAKVEIFFDTIQKKFKERALRAGFTTIVRRGSGVCIFLGGFC